MSSQTAGQSRIAVATEALHTTNYRRIFIGAFMSNCGSWMQEAAVPFVIYDQTHNSALVGLAAFAGLLPLCFFGIIGGAIADRFDRRKILMTTQGLSILGPLAMSIAWFMGFHSIPFIITILVIDGAISGLGVPSWVAYMIDCVPKKMIGNVVTLNSAQFNAARGVGPILAGLVLHFFGPSLAFLLNAVSFVAVVVAVFNTHPLRAVERKPQRKVLRELRDGFSYVRKSTTVLLCMTSGFLLASCGMTVFWLMPSFSDEVFHASSVAYGLLAGAMGLGTIIGVVVVSNAAQTRKRSSIVKLCFPLLGATLLLVSQLKILPVALLTLFVVGVLFMCVVSVVLSSVQYASTDELRGRVSSAYITTVTLALPMGTLIEGFIAQKHGAPVAMAGAAVILLVAGIGLNVVPHLANKFDIENSAEMSTTTQAEEIPLEVVTATETI